MKFIIEHLSKCFEQKEVLKDIDFTFEEGRIYGLLGRNGAGKTTLFNCLNRDIKARCRSSSPAGSSSSSLWTSILTPSGTPGPWTSILRK